MTASRVMRWVLAFIAVGIPGCEDGVGPTKPDFGASYRVELQPNAPVLSAGTLSITVHYGGCGDNRDFALQYRIRGSGADVWLHKLTPDEPCDMLLIERRSFALPDAVMAAGSVTLLAPEIEPYVLRP